MNTKLVKTVLVAYSKIRKIIEPLMFKLFSQKLEYNKHKWDLAKTMGIDDFEKYINTFEYKSDKVMGLFDMVFPLDKPEYFFSQLDWGRDCDDYARIWAIYLKRYGWEEITEVIVLNKDKPFSTSHLICVAKEPISKKYYLFNYHKYGTFSTFEEAVEDVNRWKSYDKENLLWVKYRSI